MENPIDDDIIETVEEETVDTIVEPEEETVETLTQKLESERQAREKAEKVAADQKRRAELAEANKKEIKQTTVQKKDEISSMDMYALIDAKVPQEDVDDVVSYAKYAKIPVSEALKSNIVKNILADKSENRRIADATNTSAARRGSGKVTGETLLQKASGGELPESMEDMGKLLDARYESKRK